MPTGSSISRPSSARIHAQQGTGGHTHALLSLGCGARAVIAAASFCCKNAHLFTLVHTCSHVFTLVHVRTAERAR
jgi:hypothetical protein